VSKYLKLYSRLCPDDPVASDRLDPRRAAIIAEMKAVCRAKTEAGAMCVIEWWDSWRNNEEGLLEFVRKARNAAE